MEDAALDVVIVSYRSRELLRECLASLRAHPPSCPMKVIVIDNASGDGTAEMVAAEYPETDLVVSPTNLGFASATNLGARRGDAPYVLALNPDTVWVTKSTRRFGSRSTKTPPNGPSKSTGRNCTRPTRPRAPGESVSWYSSQPTSTAWICVAMLASMPPARNRR